MMDKILYRSSQILLAMVCFFLNPILSFIFGRRGKVVPAIKNPLLIKSATKLAQEIREGKLKSEDVVQAYIERILEVEPYINATVDHCFQDSLRQAREADALVASGKYTNKQLAEEKPLFGVPFTAKVLFHVKGLPYRAASKLFESEIPTEDACAVALMRDAGAILIATTNSAEMGIFTETVNKAHGRTCNPYDTSRTSGGSSGGESALVSAGGSLIGLGNDIGGSVRIPAHCTGIFAHKPTAGLVPNKGSVPAFPNKPLQPMHLEVYKYLIPGPLCRNAEDLLTVMKVLSSKAELRMNFNRQVDFKKLKVRYLTDIRCPFVAPVDNEIKVALKNAVTFFEKKCKTVAEEVKMHSLFDINRCTLSVLLRIINHFKNEIMCTLDINENFEYLKSLCGKSKLAFPTALVLFLSNNPLVYKENKTAYYAKMIKGLAKEFDDILDEDTVLLVPTAPYVAPYHNGTLPFLFSICYTSMFNILGLPSTQCPMGFSEKNLPFGLQIVGSKNNDALTIACAVELEKAFGGWKPPVEI
ncbi:unnamed protein product [Larinioides sclopetarius]|uniref:Amidase domain-containing protein n=1 Tax=Larinioides sclopetarius TaxID=280406 RepID=A0AAV2BP78_9ARAC